MRSAIKLWWWRGGGQRTNFGDEINQRIVAYISGRPVERTRLEDADMLAIGSILSFPQKRAEFRQRQNPYHVWGSGSMQAFEIADQGKFVISALRGPLSHSLFGYRGDICFGDPAILASQIWPVSAAASHSWGIIPHHSQCDKPWVRQLVEHTPHARLIDVRDPDVEATIRAIAACEFIASSSLHGLVVADSYKIPNVWLWDGPIHHGGPWKYYDYFSGVERLSAEQIGCTAVSDLHALQLFDMSFAHLERIDDKAEALARAFPL